MKDGKAPQSLIVELDRLEKEKGRLEVELSVCKNRILSSEFNVDKAVDEISGYLDKAQGVFENGTMPQKKEILRAFLHRIDILPNERQAKFHFFKVPGNEKGIVPNLDRNDPSFHRESCGGWI